MKGYSFPSAGEERRRVLVWGALNDLASYVDGDSGRLQFFPLSRSLLILFVSLPTISLPPSPSLLSPPPPPPPGFASSPLCLSLLRSRFPFPCPLCLPRCWFHSPSPSLPLHPLLPLLLLSPFLRSLCLCPHFLPTSFSPSNHVSHWACPNYWPD